MLELIHALAYCFSTLQCLPLYFILFRSKFEYALRTWDITTSNANKRECANWKFAALSELFFPHIPYSYAVTLELLQLRTVHLKRHQFDAVFYSCFSKI